MSISNDFSADFAVELQKAISSLDKMKLEEIQSTPTELPICDTPMSSSSFSFEADPMLSLYLNEVDSLPVELQSILRDLKNKENYLVNCRDVFMRYEQRFKRINLYQEEIAQTEKELLMIKANWLNKAEGTMNLEKFENQFNYFYMALQQHMTEMHLQLEKVTQGRDRYQEQLLKMKAQYLSEKEDFMQLAFRKLNVVY